MNKSVLELEYVEPTRPYSQKELGVMRNNLYRGMRIGKTRAEHKRCGHFYLVKNNGRKEKEILKNNHPDTGNCSVCWKISRTPGNLKKTCKNLVDSYQQEFYEDKKVLLYDTVDLEKAFYTWLYEEFN